MILNVDVTGKEFVVTKRPFAKLDPHGEQRLNKTSGMPLWSTQVVVTDDEGGTIITISTEAEEPPDVVVGDEVEVLGLVATPWVGSGKSGVSYRAELIKAVAD